MKKYILYDTFLKYDNKGRLLAKIPRDNYRFYIWVTEEGDIYTLSYDLKSDMGPEIAKWTKVKNGVK